jgi:hypothetical protein
MAERLIKVHYSGRHADRASSCASFEGAIRAATVRILMGDYTSARIFDHRFGADEKAAMTLTVEEGVLVVRWTRVFTRYVREGKP